jgi:hypothetical protein
LVTAQFVKADALRVTTTFAGKQLEVIFSNPEHLAYGQYSIGEYSINGRAYQLPARTHALRFPRAEVLDWPEKMYIKVKLSS